MHRIPVQRRRIWQTDCYVWSELRDWAAQDEKAPDSLLVTLRGTKAKAIDRQHKRSQPYTKTGKLKKRYRSLLHGDCPHCRIGLIPGVIKHQAELQTDEDQEFQDAAALLATINRMSGGSLQHLVDQPPPPPPELLVEELEVRVLRCPRCRFQKEDLGPDFYEYTEEDGEHVVDDDILRMTSSAFNPETGAIETLEREDGD